MKNESAKLYRFLRAAAGNWRNAIFIACGDCSCGSAGLCAGFLLAAGADGVLILLSADWFQKQTGEQIDRDECAAVLTREAFESACSLWLKWQVDDPAQCPLMQLSA